MDINTKNELFGLLPFSGETIVSYMPESFVDLEIDEKYKPVFKLRALKKGEVEKLKRLINRISSNPINTKKDDLVDMVRVGIVGWENLYNLANDEYIDFDVDDNGVAKKVLIDTLPQIILSSIMRKLGMISGLFDKEALGLKR